LPDVARRAAEGTIIKSYSGIIKRKIEIKSIRVSGAACSIRNVFGNQQQGPRSRWPHCVKRGMF
jgi:hypothetical protein